MTGTLTGGYAGRMLRVNLTDEKFSTVPLDAELLRTYVGGAGLGAKFLYEEVPADIAWDSPENRIIMATGPLAGTRVSGTGTICVVTKAAMTNLAVSTQANGFLGAFLKFSGYDGVIIQGRSEKLRYLYIHDGQAALKEASHLAGKDTFEIDDLIKKELGKDKYGMSVFGIGPAGEKLVRWSVIAGDKGHVASKGGVGAVMGSKRLKAIAVARGQNKVPVVNMDALTKVTDALFNNAMQFAGGFINKWGTAGAMVPYAAAGLLPVKNYTTNIFPQEAAEKLSGQYMRTHFKHKPKPCWACRSTHCSWMEVTEGEYAGEQGDEPEYEGVSAFGPQIMNTDPGAVVMLSNLTDKLGLDINEAGWVIGWVMECFEKGLITKQMLDGLEPRWGNVEAVRELLIRITNREGFGDVLAEGVKRASESLGPEAAGMAVYTLKGTTPRGHDHRSRWPEMLDTCTSSASTIQAQGGFPTVQLLGKGKLSNPYDPREVSTMVGRYNGWHAFEDSIGICRFCLWDQGPLALEAFNAITGWQFTQDDALTVGRRIVNTLRVFDLRNGHDPKLEKPSPRYGSTPVDGPQKDAGIIPHWDSMLKNFRREMGWDEETGKPLPETLKHLGLEHLIEPVWGSN